MNEKFRKNTEKVPADSNWMGSASVFLNFKGFISFSARSCVVFGTDVQLVGFERSVSYGYYYY